MISLAKWPLIVLCSKGLPKLRLIVSNEMKSSAEYCYCFSVGEGGLLQLNLLSYRNVFKFKVRSR